LGVRGKPSCIRSGWRFAFRYPATPESNTPSSFCAAVGQVNPSGKIDVPRRLRCRVLSQDGRSVGIQFGWRFSMNAFIPSRGSGDTSRAPNIVW
jgi:hypothetical protein